MAVSQERVVQVGPVDGLGALTDVDLAAKDAEVGAASRLNLVVTPFRYWGVTISRPETALFRFIHLRGKFRLSSLDQTPVCAILVAVTSLCLRLIWGVLSI